MRKDYSKLTIRDPFIFGKVAMDPENCKGILEALFNEKMELVNNPRREHFIQVRKDGKSVRMDIYALGDRNRAYDLEMQNHSKNSVVNKQLPLRSRYYHSLIDAGETDAGNFYEELKEAYVIFICTFDPFDMGLYKYTVTAKCEESPELIYNDKSYTIYYNIYGDMSDATESERALLEYIRDGRVSNTITEQLECSVKRARANEEWRNEYMRMSPWEADARYEGKEEGREEGREETVLLMKAVLEEKLSEEELISRGYDERLVKQVLNLVLQTQ